jgi:hypothetical protein
VELIEDEAAEDKDCFHARCSPERPARPVPVDDLVAISYALDATPKCRRTHGH